MASIGGELPRRRIEARQSRPGKGTEPDPAVRRLGETEPEGRLPIGPAQVLDAAFRVVGIKPVEPPIPRRTQVEQTRAQGTPRRTRPHGGDGTRHRKLPATPRVQVNVAYHESAIRLPHREQQGGTSISQDTGMQTRPRHAPHRHTKIAHDGRDGGRHLPADSGGHPHGQPDSAGGPSPAA
jgi:hypothetical protein